MRSIYCAKRTLKNSKQTAKAWFDLQNRTVSKFYDEDENEEDWYCK